MNNVTLFQTRTPIPTILRFMCCLGVTLTLANASTAALIKHHIEDKDITNHIESEYWVDPAVPSNAVDIHTEKGIVILEGTVRDILAKERAAAIAEATVGVRAVVNRLRVQPSPQQSDGDIEQAVKRALLMDPVTELFGISVAVDNGTVTLTGTVDSWQEKQECTTVTKGVSGVVDLENNIVPEYKPDRPDFEIKPEVENRLADDLRVDDALIEVKVKNGKVSLMGTVGSLQEKNMAHRLAWVGGVQSVDTDGLDVEWWARDKMRRQNLYMARTDAEIANSVQDAFLYDLRVAASDMDVDVSDSVVTLRGTVDNLMAKKAAARDARNTIGVSRVINHIKVQPSPMPQDGRIKNNIAEAFHDDPYIDRIDLDISVVAGIAYLNGSVNTSWEKQRAESLAEDIWGVLYVVNNLRWEHAWVWKSDWEIRQDVKSQLFWSPFVDEDQVSVLVDDGIVRLSGEVDTVSERQSAEDNTFEGGAKDVINNLDVNHRQFGPYYHPSVFAPYGY